MALNFKLLAVPPQAFTANGGTLGEVSITRPWLFKTGQSAIIQSTAQPAIQVEVKRVLDTVVYVGPDDGNLETRLDISAYLVADNATISAVEQRRPIITDEQAYNIDYYEHAEEPTVARRSHLVDLAGRSIDSQSVGSLRGLVVVSTPDPLSLPIDVNVVSPSPVPVSSPTPLNVNVVSPSPVPVSSPTPLNVNVVSPSPVPVSSPTPLDVNPSPLNGNFTTTAFSVTHVSPTLVSQPSITNRKKIFIQNLGNEPIFLGGNTVTPTNGFRVLPSANVLFDAGPSLNIYAISSTSPVDVRVLEIS